MFAEKVVIRFERLNYVSKKSSDITIKLLLHNWVEQCSAVGADVKLRSLIIHAISLEQVECD